MFGDFVPPRRRQRSGSPGRVLHLAVAERPVFGRYIDQADPDVLPAQPRLLRDALGDRLVEGPLDRGRASGVPGDLDEDDAGRVADAQVAIGRMHQLVVRVARDDLETVVGGHVRDPDHGVVDDVTDGAHGLGRGRPGDVDAGKRHAWLSRLDRETARPANANGLGPASAVDCRSHANAADRDGTTRLQLCVTRVAPAAFFVVTFMSMKPRSGRLLEGRIAITSALARKVSPGRTGA